MSYIIKSLLFFSLCICLLPDSFSQEIQPISSIPEELKKDAYAIVQYKQEHISVTSKRQAYNEKIEIITILNEKGDHLAVKGTGFNKSFFMRPEVSGEIYDAKGKLVRRLKKKDQIERSAISENSIYEDNKVLLLDLRHNSYPYTIVFKSSQNTKDLYILPTSWNLYPEEHVSIMSAHLQVELIPEVSLRYKTHKVEEAPTITTVKGKKRYSWTFKNKKPFKNETYAPSRNDPFIRMVPETFVAGELSGSYKSWKDLGAFYYELNKGRDELPKEMKTKVHALVDGLSSPEEKIDVLYRHMQANTRYVSVQLGIGGFQTFDANYVYKNGYGDCKALSNYMKSMLKEIGLTSYVGAIYSDDNPPPFYEDFSAPQFNHVILCVPQEQDTLWLECTSPINPMGYLGSSTEDRNILLYTPEGGKLVKTPSRSPEENGQVRIADIYLEKDGNATAKMDVYYSGYQQEIIRGGVQVLSTDDQKKWLRHTIDLGSYDIDNFAIIDEAATTKPRMKVHSEISARNFASLSGNRLFLPLRAVEAPYPIPKANKERTQEIELSYPYLDTDTLTYHLPEDFRIEGMPDLPVRVEEDFGVYEVNVEILDPSTLRYTRKLMMQKKVLPASRYNDFRDFHKKINKLDRLQVVLANKS